MKLGLTIELHNQPSVAEVQQRRGYSNFKMSLTIISGRYCSDLKDGADSQVIGLDALNRPKSPSRRIYSQSKPSHLFPPLYIYTHETSLPRPLPNHYYTHRQFEPRL